MTNRQKKSTRIDFGLWTAQIILSASFTWAGLLKLFQSPEELAGMWPWAGENPVLAPLTGVFDLLAGLGLVLPAMLRIRPELTAYAAVGAMALMVAAAVFHVSRGEGSEIGPNVVFFVLSAFVAWGRTKVMPLPSR